jgi:hypothetical protein
LPDDKLHVSGEIGPDEEALARELAELGPLMLRQERTEAEMPDPDFVRNLRTRLMDAETALPDPQFARDLRARLTGMGGLRPVAAQRTWRRAAVWAAATAAALVAVVIAVLASRGLPLSPGRGTAIVAWAPPAPGTGDLIRGFPFPPVMGGGGAGGGGLISPEVSQFDAPWNAPYPGRLRLSAGKLHEGTTNLPAYQLRGPSFDAPHVARLAHLLGIRARATRAVSAGAIWAVAADGGLPSQQPLHSLAVSTATGELVYHNTAYQALAGPPPQAQDRARVVRARVVAAARVGDAAGLARPGHAPASGRAAAGRSQQCLDRRSRLAPRPWDADQPRGDAVDRATVARRRRPALATPGAVSPPLRASCERRVDHASTGRHPAGSDDTGHHYRPARRRMGDNSER